jgi:parallel beta-helix repeat protein
VLEENDIFANLLAEVAIKSGGRPMVRRNRIHDGKQNGVLVEDHGQGVLEDNSIHKNAYAGVLITGNGNPTLRRNRIKKNGYKAIVVEGSGMGVVENNDLRGNQAGALDIAHESKLNLSLAHNKE